MKRMLYFTLGLLMCFMMCMFNAVDVFALNTENDIPSNGQINVHFYNEKDYDLIGLRVEDMAGNELKPISCENGWTYLLDPGNYTYQYHDERNIFLDVEKTGFRVISDMLEIPVTLTASFADTYFCTWTTNPFSDIVTDDTAILDIMPTREEMVDSFVARLLAEYDQDTGGLVSNNAVDANDSENAGTILRKAMVNREARCDIIFYSDMPWEDNDYENYYFSTWLMAVQHTGNHREGDTLKKNIGTMGHTYTGGYYVNGQYQYIISFINTYYTTAVQEQITADTVENLITSLSLIGKSDYEKAYAINQWLYQNVDYDNTSDETYKLKFTDYAALVNRYAVCQGFATAFYRLCLAAGVDARYISSIVMNHGWNIVKLNGNYYEVDATWDSNIRESGGNNLPFFFARGSTWWLTNHTLSGDTYSTIGDQFDHNSYMYVNPEFKLEQMTLLVQYGDFDNYLLSQTDYDPSLTGVAINAGNFPDAAFRTYVLNICDTNQNGYLSDEEIAAVTVITCPGKEDAPGAITTLKGIEFFVALKGLSCSYNQLTNLNLNQNRDVEVVFCDNNQLTALSISECGALKYLICNNNKLINLNIEGCTALEGLMCSINNLTSLNVSGKTALKTLSCDTNSISYLNLDGCTALETLSCSFNQLMNLDVSSNKSLKTLDCISNQLGKLDISNNLALLRLGCAINQLTKLNVRNNTELQTLVCDGNQLTSLDVSSNTALQSLTCSINKLTSLDVSNNTALQTLSCAENQITNLDISKCPSLRSLAENIQAKVDTEYNYISYTGENSYLSYDITVVFIIYTPDFILPAALTTIGEEAFVGGAFTCVKLPDGAVSIGTRAFADCPNLAYIYIPASVTNIDTSAFGDKQGLTVIGVLGSPAETFAGDHGFTFIPSA